MFFVFYFSLPPDQNMSQGGKMFQYPHIEYYLGVIGCGIELTFEEFSQLLTCGTNTGALWGPLLSDKWQ